MTPPEKFFQYYQKHGSIDLNQFLPPPASYTEWLTAVNLLKAGLDSFRPLNPAIVANLKAYFEVKFTYHSNAIEGSTLTERETALVLEKGLTIGGKPLRDHLEALGQRDAIQWLEKITSEPNRPITATDLLELHRLIFYKVDATWAGKYRTMDVRIVGTNKIFSSFLQVPALMTDFITWLNSLATRQLPTIERAAEAHYRLVNLHPFVDGNGRLARLLMNLILMQQGFPGAIIMNEQRMEYLQTLEQADSGDLLPFKLVVIKAVQRSLCDYLNLIAPAETREGKGGEFFEYIAAYLA